MDYDTSVAIMHGTNGGIFIVPRVQQTDHRTSGAAAHGRSGVMSNVPVRQLTFIS